MIDSGLFLANGGNNEMNASIIGDISPLCNLCHDTGWVAEFTCVSDSGSGFWLDEPCGECEVSADV